MLILLVLLRLEVPRVSLLGSLVGLPFPSMMRSSMFVKLETETSDATSDAAMVEAEVERRVPRLSRSCSCSFCCCIFAASWYAFESEKYDPASGETS